MRDAAQQPSSVFADFCLVLGENARTELVFCAAVTAAEQAGEGTCLFCFCGVSR